MCVRNKKFLPKGDDLAAAAGKQHWRAIRSHNNIDAQQIPMEFSWVDAG